MKIKQKIKILLLISIFFFKNAILFNPLFSSGIDLNILTSEEREYGQDILKQFNSVDPMFFDKQLFSKEKIEYFEKQGIEYLSCLEKTTPPLLFLFANVVIKYPLCFIPVSSKIYNYFCKEPLSIEKNDYTYMEEIPCTARDVLKSPLLFPPEKFFTIPLNEWLLRYLVEEKFPNDFEPSFPMDVQEKDETVYFYTPFFDEEKEGSPPISEGFSPLKPVSTPELKSPFNLSIQQGLRFYVINEEPYVTLTQKNAETCDLLLDFLEKNIDHTANLAQEHFENAIKTFGILKREKFL